MNIGIDIRALSNSQMSGIGNYIYNSVKTLAQIDNRNNYYLFSSGYRDTVSTWFDIKKDNVHHIHYKIPNKFLHGGILTGLGPNVTNKTPVKLDLFWLPNLNFYKSNKNIPTILTIHDLSFLHNTEFYSLKRRLWHKLVKVHSLVKQADKIIAVSDNTKRDIVRFFSVPKDKVEVIYPGTSATKIDKEAAEKIIEKFDIKNKYFLYVGTIEPRKNILNIIKAFDRLHKEHKDIDLVIVGSKGWLYKGIMKMINTKSYIHYLDYVRGSEKDALYCMSQGLIWPSFYEGFGFPPLEATFHGIPVIASYKTSLPEIMKQQALYVDPYNTSDTYQALKLLVCDDTLKKDLIESSKEFEIPNWTKQTQKILNIFENTTK
ncbi:glycosyltransferase family 4 protein [Candidatus Parcubacteria bacterium]|jgi:glycosyltransferase involved in cell wall biosynthesis|nr:glycosyltransferase family 4 protein [Candidatus Parcubacteria bacterium]